MDAGNSATSQLGDFHYCGTKGSSDYSYDAADEKLQKVAVDSPANKKTTILYIGGFVYQNTSTLTGSGTDTLQFIANEEGRVRWAYHKYTTCVTAYKFAYDFFEKDRCNPGTILNFLCIIALLTRNKKK